VDMRTTRQGQLKLKFVPVDGSFGWSHIVHNFDSDGGVFMSLYNTDTSIK